MAPIISREEENCTCFTLSNGSIEVEILDLGGIVKSIRVPNSSGEIADVTLGYDKAAEYGKFYFGALIGRFANRIGLGKFTLDGVHYNLAVNNGPNHLHGGIVGFDKKVWNATVNGEQLVLKYHSVDSEENYPGDLSVQVVYEVTDQGELVIDYKATCNKPTIINLTNHAYFNLEGHDKNDLSNHRVMLTCQEYTPTDSTSIPTGEVKSVQGSPFDLTQEKLLTRETLSAVPGGIGYDHNFVVPGQVGQKRLVGIVKAGGRVLETYTTQPGVQFYTSYYVNCQGGKSGTNYGQYSAFCLETQNYPDAPNKPNFPSSVLRPGEEYHHTTWYKFSPE